VAATRRSPGLIVTLIELGFFRELRHGDPQGPSIVDALEHPLPPELRDTVARYLERGTVVIATTGRADDVVDPANRDVSGINVRSDGDVVWSEDLASYVRTYGARVPDEVVRRARAGAPRPLDPDAVQELVGRFAPPPPQSGPPGP
jgi:hypothetical protein